MPVFLLIFMLFFVISIIEVYLFAWVGSMIGAGATVLLVVLMAMAGVFLVRFQGIRTLMTAQAQLSQGLLPTQALLEGPLILLAGVLLLIPGFFTDIWGLLLLVPPLRRMFLNGVLGFFHAKKTVNTQPKPGARTLEGEFWKDK